MRRRILLGIIMLTVVVISSMASAATINLSMNPSAWNRYQIMSGGTDSNTSPAIIELTVDSHLKGTKTTGTGGTGWSLGLDTDDTYNFQDATLRYLWRLNGQGSYSGIYSGVMYSEPFGAVNNVDPNPPYAGFLTTGWSWAGSEIITSNQWLYTQFVFSGSGYNFAVSRTGYGNNDFLYGSKILTTAVWDAIANAHVSFFS